MRPLAFIDTETDGLGWNRRAWEYGLVLVEYESIMGVRLPEPHISHHVWHVADFVEDEHSDPDALRIGGYRTRYGVQPPGLNPSIGDYYLEPLAQVIAGLDDLLDGAQIIGSAPWFDTHIIEREMREQVRVDEASFGHWTEEPMSPKWYHRMRDIGSVATGWFGDPDVGGLDDVAERLGVLSTIPESDRHTALGDALLGKACWEAMMGPVA